MGKSRDLSEYERGLIVGARSAGCSISQTVNRLGFSKTAVSRVYREWCGKKKTSSERGACGRKRLVDEMGEKRMERVVEANNQATITEIQSLYNFSVEKPISLTTTQRVLKRLGYTRGPTQRDSVFRTEPVENSPSHLSLDYNAETASCRKHMDPSQQDAGTVSSNVTAPEVGSTTTVGSRCS